MGRALRIFFVFLGFCTLSNAGEPLRSCAQIVNEFLQHYARHVTIVEFPGDKQPLCMILPQSSRWWYVIVPGSEGRSCVHAIRTAHISHVAVMNPLVITAAMLDTLGRCESPDCVIVQQSSLCNEQMARQLMQLGDYCIFIGNPTMMQSLKLPESQCVICESAHDGRTVMLYKTGKRGLDIARWACRAQPRTGGTKYCVESSFKRKELIKRGGRYPWLPGINLMSFVALRGIYPTHERISSQIKLMKQIDHNDLVIGNMLVQGTAIVPIDFNDERRNGKRRRCIKAALALFKKHHRLLLSNPEEALATYHSLIIKGGA